MRTARTDDTQAEALGHAGRDDVADMLRLARRVRHRELARHQRWARRHLDCDNSDEISRAHRHLDEALRNVADELTDIAVDQLAIHRMRCLPSPPRTP